MVLIIRNNRLQSRRHSKAKNPLKFIDSRNREIKVDDNIEQSKVKEATMSNVTVLATLLLYSTAMFTMPFVAFYGVRSFMENNLTTDRFINNCVSVIAAVIVVNMIIASYAYRALKETDDPAPREIQSDDDAPVVADKKKD